MAENDKNLKIEAIRCSAGVHSARVAAGKDTESKPEDVVSLAEKIYTFLSK